MQPIKLRIRKLRYANTWNAIILLQPLYNLAILQQPSEHCSSCLSLNSYMLIFKHIIHFNASVCMSCHPCVYIALTNKSRFKPQKERRDWRFCHNLTSTQHARNINSSQAQWWKHKICLPDMLSNTLPTDSCGRTSLLHLYKLYLENERVHLWKSHYTGYQECFLYLKEAWYEFTHSFWDFLSSNHGCVNVSSTFAGIWIFSSQGFNCLLHRYCLQNGGNPEVTH